ncbi:MAG: MBL fold metallo-hydrolase [Planctomycetota bacterium]|nr:MBL fold metallo-hydrolase [Planctomycetota bacterium]MDA1106315.1 MBL fold metallo-hydrolase [Planctomycetota bacterium]
MILRRLHDDALAQSAYLVGCEVSREVVVVDPERDADRVLALARQEGWRVIAAIETHVHADFVSGVPALCERQGIPAWVSGVCGEPRWIGAMDETARSRVRLLGDGDELAVGGIRLRVLHTPGHTPEAISLAVVDESGTVRALLTGDFLFAGGVGRPDLGAHMQLEGADRVAAAKTLQAALARLGDLGDDVMVYPGHTAGSPCGRMVASMPVTKMGIERRINGVLKSCDADSDEFAKKVLSELPDPPAYFGRVKRLNISGACCAAGDVPPTAPALDTDTFLAALARPASVVVDCRAWPRFNEGFVQGAISAPLDKFFAMSAGSYLEPGDEVVLVCAPDEVELAVRALWRVGVEEFAGWLDGAAYDAIPDRILPIEEIEEVSSPTARRRWEQQSWRFVDVRNCLEFERGHLPNAEFAPFTQLPERCAEWDRSQPLICYCRSGNRSARACTYLRRRGFTVANLRGGYWPWAGRGFPIESGAPAGRPRC